MEMNLYIIRHAIAEERRVDLTDAKRRLTRKGRRRFEEVASGLERLGVHFECVYHSPWLRAVETAELLEPIADSLAVTPHLATSPSHGLLDELEGGCVAVVGHEPWMSELLVWLCAGVADVDVSFKKGGIAWLQGEARPGGMTLRALLPPRWLLSLAR